VFVVHRSPLREIMCARGTKTAVAASTTAFPRDDGPEINKGRESMVEPPTAEKTVPVSFWRSFRAGHNPLDGATAFVIYSQSTRCSVGATRRRHGIEPHRV